MPTLSLKPTHKTVAQYYASPARFTKLGTGHEGAVKSGFGSLSASKGMRPP